MHHFEMFVPLWLFLLIFSVLAVDKKINTGTALYGKRDLMKIWTEREAVRLYGRMVIEQLIPKRVPTGTVFVGYIQLTLEKLEIIENSKSKHSIARMLADVLGSYMHCILLPRVQASYYEDNPNGEVMEALVRMMRKIKFVLDTDGRGWARPFTGDFSGPVAAATVAPVPDPCSALRLDPLSGEVPLPAFDDDRNPGSVAVPFASGRRLFSVDAIDGDRPLLRYYALASGCVESPQFRRKLHGWFNHTVRPLLAPGRRWYPALAGASVVIQQSAAAATDRFKRSGGDGDPTWTGLRRSEKSLYDELELNEPCDGDLMPQRLPNSNVFLLILLVSLVCSWVCFGFLDVHKKTRYLFRLTGLP